LVELSTATYMRLQRVFAPELREEAEKVLVEECADNLPWYGEAGPLDLERVRFAVLKLSHGDPGELGKWIELAKLDWRDVLMNAGFGDDISAHKRWEP
jgi:hypothetical protein